MSRKPKPPSEPLPDAASANRPLVTYKGFDKDFACRGHKFEVGQTYTVSGKIQACANGFHACANPFDVWSYYPVVADDGSLTRYGEVLQSGDLDRHADDSKIASATLTVRTELKLPDFLGQAIAWIIDAAKAALQGTTFSTEDAARIGSSGNAAQIGSSGNAARIVADGERSVVACAGRDAAVSGSVGTWMSLAEYDESDRCIGFATGRIGDGGLEPGVAYRTKGGKLIPA